MLNRNLPDDIRILDCVEVPDEWNARYDCLSREYMYFFMRRGLDVKKMDEACQLLVGQHDFRNLCKLNVVQNESFVRAVLHAGIYSAKDMLYGTEGWGLKPGEKMEQHIQPIIKPKLDNHGSPYDMFYLRIRGTAFLWHQVVVTNYRFDAS